MTLAAGRHRVLLAFLVLLAAGCTSASSPDSSSPLSFERAIVTREHVEEAAAIEQDALQRQRFAQLLQGLTRFVRAVGQ